MYYNPFGHYNDSNTKRMQVVFLKECMNLSFEKIAEITSYALSTVKKYAKKFLNLLKKAKQIFIKRVNSIIETICDLGKTKTEKCYLIKFYNSKNEIIFSKIGTTTREVVQRLREEIKNYRKGGFDVRKAIICKVIDCGKTPAEGAESYCKAIFIKQYQGAFKKNDRFMKVDIPINDFIEAVMGYLRE